MHPIVVASTCGNVCADEYSTVKCIGNRAQTCCQIAAECFGNRLRINNDASRMLDLFRREWSREQFNGCPSRNERIALGSVPQHLRTEVLEAGALKVETHQGGMSAGVE